MPTYDPDKKPTEVRQANRRKMSFRVLFWSMIGVVLVFSVIYLYFAITTPPTGS